MGRFIDILCLSVVLVVGIYIVGCGEDTIIPQIDSSTQDKDTINIDESVKFSVDGSAGADFSFYWQKNDDKIDNTPNGSKSYTFTTSGSNYVNVWIEDVNGVKSAKTKFTIIVNGNSEEIKTDYPLHSNITASTFWCGEGASSDNDFITNTASAWDIKWGSKFGIEDKPLISRNSDFIPTSSSYKKTQNPYYFALPYDDYGSLVYDGAGTIIDNAPTSGGRKTSTSNIYWLNTKTWGYNESMVKNRWIQIRISGTNKYCYAQWEDAGPYYYNDYNYVFDPAKTIATNLPLNTTDSPYAGIDLAPSVCLYLGKTLNSWGAEDFDVDWSFIDEAKVPLGPWKTYVTTSQVDW